MAFKYNISIKGNGTPSELKKALQDIISNIDEAEQSKLSTCGILDGAEWECETLETTIGQWGSTENKA
jgi:hypothetical protein